MAESCLILTIIPLLRKAAAISNEIHSMIQLHGEKNGALKEVESKIELVNSVLCLMEPNVQSVQIDMLKKVVKKLEDLQHEVERVKKMKRVVYLLQAKDCQDKLRSKIDTVQFYLNSLHFNQTNTVCSQIEEIKKLLCQDWESTVKDDRDLLNLLENERQEDAEFKRQVQTKKLQIEHLQKLGLNTRSELEEALKQTEEEHQRRLKQTRNAKSRVEAEYLELVIELLSATDFPPNNGDKSKEKKRSKKSRKSKKPKPPKNQFDPTCSICLERFQDPVIIDCECRGTVDKSCFKKWCNRTKSEAGGRPNCPLCGLPLQSLRVWPNVHLQDWLMANPLPDQDVVLINRHKPDPGDEQIIVQVHPPNENLVKLPKQDPRHESIIVQVDPPNVDQIRPPIQVPVADPAPDPGIDLRKKLFCTKRQVWITLLLLLLIGTIVGIVIGVLGGNDEPVVEWTPSPPHPPLNLTVEPTQPPTPVPPLFPYCHTFDLRIEVVPNVTAPAPAEDTPHCQLGLALEGKELDVNFGWAVALSSDGSRVAIGANDNQAGHVRILDWSGTRWIQAGFDLIGEAAGDEFGRSISLSSDGNRVAIGAVWNDGNGENAGHVRIFEWSGRRSWVQVGSELNGEAAGDHFGGIVALSSDGNHVAIGADRNDGNGNKAGHVRIYNWSESQWDQVGSDLDGEAAGDHFGWSVTLSANGTRVAIGAPEVSGNGDVAGYVRIFDWSGSQWIQVGSDLDGEAAGDHFGWSVTLSANGTRVAIGAFQDGSSGSDGYVRIFDWTGSQWVQVGSDLNGYATGDNFGWSVALSADGNRVAIVAFWNDGIDDSSGYVRIFDWSGSQWMQLGPDFKSGAADGFGGSMALSADGSRVAIGTYWNDTTGANTGYVRMFQLGDY